MSEQVVVLGAGMVGVGTALALQARGFDVALVDRVAPGSETSFGNAGFIQGEAFEPYALPRALGKLAGIALKRDNSVDWDLRGLLRHAPALFAYWRNSAPVRHRRISAAYAPLIRQAVQSHGRLIAESGADRLIRRGGYRLILRDHRSFDEQARSAEAWRQRYGAACVIEDGAALAAAEPALRERLAGAIRWQDAWTCSDPGGLVKAYADLFRRRGGNVIVAELRGLAQRGAGWEVATTDGAIAAGDVVVALGPWSPDLLAPLGYHIPMIPKRGHHLGVEYPAAGAAPDAPRLALPLIDAHVGAVYTPMLSHLRICTGADLSAAPARGVPRQVRVAHAALGKLLDIGPPVAGAPWSGVRPCLPDMMPMVGAAPRHSGLWFNFGHGHQGFTLGPTTGALLAGIMAGDPDPIAAPLAPSRPGLA